MGFYQTIHTQYGIEKANLFKQWAKTNIKISSLKNRKIFLLRCRKDDITPPHITNGTKNVEALINFQDGYTGQKILKFNNRLDSKLINLEIDITIATLKKLEKHLIQIIEQLKNHIPNHVINEFQNRQHVTSEKHFKKVKNRNLKKFNNLKNQQHELHISTQDKWIKNLTNLDIPQEILRFLSLGFKFSIEPTNKEISVKRLISDIENIIRVLPNNIKNVTRAKLTNILTNYFRKPEQKNYLNILFQKTKFFF